MIKCKYGKCIVEDSMLYIGGDTTPLKTFPRDFELSLKEDIENRTRELDEYYNQFTSFE